MKSEREVIEWLKTKRLYGRIINYNGNEYIRGLCEKGIDLGEFTIASAFDWNRAPEGDSFWYERSEELRSWYRH